MSMVQIHQYVITYFVSVVSYDHMKLKGVTKHFSLFEKMFYEKGSLIHSV